MKRGFAESPGRRIRIIMQLAIGLGFVFAVLNNASAKEVYTWVDENGIPHYSDMPPDVATSKSFNVEEVYKPGSTGSNPPDSAGAGADTATPMQSAAQQRREDIARDRKERNAKRAETEKMCARYQKLLADVEPARRVMYTNEDGETVRMDDDARMELVSKSKDYISKNCK